MNPVEQKAHTKRTDQLAAELEALETLHLETARRVLDHERLHVQHKKDLDAHSGELMLLRTLNAQTHERIDSEVRALESLGRQYGSFVHRGFWGRLRWLLTGK